MKKRLFFIWSLLLVTIGSFGSNKVYKQVITEQFRNEIAGIALNDSFPSADRFGNLYPGTVAQNIINVINTDPSGVQLTKSEREYVIAIVSGLRPVWSKMKAVYGFVGGNEWKHKWNWKDMRDLDQAFRLSFFGSLTHSNTGIRSDGFTGYANTHIVTSRDLSSDVGMSMGWYTNENLARNTTEYVMGSSNGNTAASFNNSLIIKRSGNNSIFIATGFATSPNNRIDAVGVVNSIGITVGNILSQAKLFHNGEIIGSNSSFTPNVKSTFNTFLFGSTNAAGSIDALTITNKPCQFSFIGSGLTDQQAIQMSHTITTAQGILNRQ